MCIQTKYFISNYTSAFWIAGSSCILQILTDVWFLALQNRWPEGEVSPCVLIETPHKEPEEASNTSCFKRYRFKNLFIKPSPLPSLRLVPCIYRGVSEDWPRMFPHFAPHKVLMTLHSCCCLVYCVPWLKNLNLLGTPQMNGPFIVLIWWFLV